MTFKFFYINHSKKNFQKLLKKKTQKESFGILIKKLLIIYSSVSNLLRFGPATKPTSPKRTREPIPTPAAQGLKPPMANEANKFIDF